MIAFLEGIFKMIELPENLLMFHLQIGKGGMAPWAPIDDIMAAVYQTFLIKPYEDLLDRLGEAPIHGEPFATPVTGSPQFL
jgi:hypothetical protein